MKEEIKYHIVYITTNLINNKQYVGDHSTYNINDKYLGSGLNIKKAIKKYGRQSFKKEILEIFDTKLNAFNAQEKYIIKYNTLSPNGYNLSIKGGLQVSGSMSNESKLKYSLTRKGKKPTPEAKEARRKGLLGHSVSEKVRENTRNINLGKHLSKETIEKFKKSKLNMSSELRKKISENTKLAMARPEVKLKVSNAAKGRVPWNKGIKLNKTKCIYCNKNYSKVFYDKYHINNCKYKP